MTTYTYKVKIPTIFTQKKYDFIFIGYEKSGELIRRKDIPYTEEFIYETFNEPIGEIVFLAYIDGDWEDTRITVQAKQHIVNKYDDLILPVYDTHQNIEVPVEEFNQRVTVVFIDEGHQEIIDKIIYMYNCIGITNIKIINSQTVDMEPLRSLEDYDSFCIKELYKYVDTEFCLICQWDGFIVNYNRIKPYFFHFDYIGAPFYHDTKSELGNGGFSLRSKKFLKTVAELFRGVKIDQQEDQFLQNHIDQLHKAGLKFPSMHIKDNFSVELFPYNGQFGFHGYLTKNLPPVARQFFKNSFHHSGDLGDIIFSLPTIKALGGGVLFLTDDIRYFKTREQFKSHTYINTIKEFLNKQEYIVEVYADHRTPYDVDYDLNKFRLPQLLDQTGQLPAEKADQINKERRMTTITQLHLQTFNCPKDADTEPWLKWNKKVVYENKPIIVNRTDRYQNPDFPWFEICKKYGEYMYFVGTYDEYKSFITEFGKIDYLHTPTIVSLVETIIGSKLLIGNMSFPVALAEGFKHNCLVESGIEVQSNNYQRHNILVPDPLNINKAEIFRFINEYVGL